MAKRRRMIDTSIPDDEVVLSTSRTKKRIARKGQWSRLEALGDRLTTLSETAFARLDLDDETVHEVRHLAGLGPGGALPRQRRRVARVLNAYDVDELERLIDDAEGGTVRGRAPAHRLERLRRDLLENSEDTLRRIYDEYPDADHQRLGQAVRAARKESAAGDPGRRFKELFKVMKKMGLGEPPAKPQTDPTDEADAPVEAETE